MFDFKINKKKEKTKQFYNAKKKIRVTPHLKGLSQVAKIILACFLVFV